MNLDELLGQTVDFFGVDNNAFCVRSNNTPSRLAFEAVEDEDDGYRSMLEEVKQVTLKDRIFFREPIARVVVEKDDHLRGYRLVDAETLHVWLRIGTCDWDDYYPMFTFDYTPAKERTIPVTEEAVGERVIVEGKKVFLDGTFVVTGMHSASADQIARNLRVALASSKN